MVVTRNICVLGFYYKKGVKSTKLQILRLIGFVFVGAFMMHSNVRVYKGWTVKSVISVAPL